MTGDHFFIGGTWARPASEATVDLVSPATEQVWARAAVASTDDVDLAVAGARTAFDSGPWPRMTLAERLEVLGRFAEIYRGRHEELAGLLTAEMGCPIALSRTMQAAAPQAIADAMLDQAQRYPFRSVRRSTGGNALVTRDPIGVVAAIVPWNAPQSTAMLKLIPALAAGCTVVLKSAPETPLDANLLAECFEAAGLPAGVLNVLCAERDVSEHLVVHPDVDKVAFTGSTAAGRRIAALCGNDLRRVTLELGGKSAAVVLADADLDTVPAAVRTTSMRNSGQTCSNKTRILDPRQRENEIVEQLAALVAGLRVGDPSDAATDIGPLVSARQRERVESYVEEGRSTGAKLVVGGGRPVGLDRGWCVEPTLFTEVDPSMTIAREEIFGPVLSVLTYDTEDDAVAMANDSAYGLNGSVFTTDLDHGVAVASRIRTGAVEINGHTVGFHAPVGGFKDSGLGREAGPEGFDAYTEPRSIGLPASYAAALGG